ncbi:AP2 domain-containing protein [Fictibacillus sp. Mic-4]|uniref:AP2 domain-containing protein n=1 Tax=Fictibacillus sp. Mic-4 TaxID=3132826 RepID=UPI003CEB5141
MESKSGFREIPLTKGKVAIVDEEDYEKLSRYKWFTHGEGYAARAIWKPKRGIILLHRQIIGAKAGEIVDHINGDRLDNRKKNLRISDYKGNARNTVQRKKNGYKGVYRTRNNQRWRACISTGGKQIHIGTFDCEIEAALAYNKKALELFGEFARINEIDNNRRGA